MANPRLPEKTKRAIEAEIQTGASNRQIAKKLKVATGTVSNVRNGLVIDDKVELLRVKKKEVEARKNYIDALKDIQQLRRELSLFTQVSDYSRHFRPVDIQPKHGGKGEATAIICAADWHMEEKITLAAVNGVNEYNLDIADRRIKRFWASAAGLVDMCRSRSIIQTIVVNVLGDLINGWIHDVFVATNELTPPQAVLAAFDYLVSGLEFIKKETKAKEIIVPCVCGNHGRITKKKWDKLGPETNFDWLIYQLAARYFEAKRDKVIRFVLPQGDMTYIKIYDRTIRLSHGDNIRYQGGIGGVHVPLRKAIDTWNTYKQADYNYFGHWHTDLTGEDYRISGSVVGFNEFCIRIKARFQRPSQAFELQHPRYGATARFPIIVD